MEEIERMQRCRATLEQKVQELHNHPGIEVEAFDVRPPVPETELAKLEERFGQLPSTVRAFYATMDGFQLKWRHSDSGTWGSVAFYSLKSLEAQSYRVCMADSSIWKECSGYSDEWTKLVWLDDYFVDDLTVYWLWDGESDPEIYFDYSETDWGPQEQADFAFSSYLDFVIQAYGSTKSRGDRALIDGYMRNKELTLDAILTSGA